jgi:hypothetical protein
LPAWLFPVDCLNRAAYCAGMTPTSTAQFLADLLQRTEALAEQQAAEFLKILLVATWTDFKPYLPYAAALLFIWLVVTSVQAMFGRTGMLGSLFYHVFYFAILGIVLWIWGLQLIFNPLFDLICFAIYRFCYWLTGLALERFK